MVWATAARFPGFEISEYGDCRRAGTTRRIAGFIDPDGYIRYVLTRDDGARVSIAAHRLVLETFVGPPPSGSAVAAHGNGSRVFCHVSNLRWATPRQNHDDRRFHGNTPQGVRNPKARISEREVTEIRVRYREIKRPGSGLTVSELDEEFGLCRAQIIRIATGRAWSHVPMPDFSEMKI